MKSRDWQKFLEEQKEQYGKTLFTVTELAHSAGVSPVAVNVELSRLRKYGLIVQYAQGKYGLPSAVDPEKLLDAIDSGAYISGGYALDHYGLVTQVHMRITSITNRRHGLSRVRKTPLGTYEFITVKPSLYVPPANGHMAIPEQALCDYIYLTKRRGIDAHSLVTFRKLDRLKKSVLKKVVSRYPKTVREQVNAILTLK